MSKVPGLEEYDCYDEFWLNSDLDNMSYIFEFCDKYVRQIKGVDWHIDEIKFLTAFMNSMCRQTMEIGHPKLLSQAAYNTIEAFIEVDCNNDISEFRFTGVERRKFAHYQLFWVGHMYAYIHYHTKLSSPEIIARRSIEEMLEDYWTGHEMSDENYFDKAKWIFS